MKRITVRPLKSRQLIVLVDLDGVLLDFEKQFLRKFRAIYPDEPFIPCEDRNTFDPAEQYATLPNAADNIVELVQSIYRGKHFFRDAPTIDGGIQAINEMSEIDGSLWETSLAIKHLLLSCKLNIVMDIQEKSYDWVKNHLGKHWLKKLILTADKTVVKGHLLIDDKVDIKGVIKKPSWEHVVFTSCYNTNIDIGDIICLDNWTDGTWRTIVQDSQMNL